MRGGCLLLVVVLVALLSPPQYVTALHEEEARLHSWEHPSVGIPSSAVRCVTGSKALHFVASASAGMMASIRPSSGELAWRRPVPSGMRIQQLVCDPAGKYVLALALSQDPLDPSTPPSMCVLAFRQDTGSLGWDTCVTHSHPYQMLLQQGLPATSQGVGKEGTSTLTLLSITTSTSTATTQRAVQVHTWTVGQGKLVWHWVGDQAPPVTGDTLWGSWQAGALLLQWISSSSSSSSPIDSSPQTHLVKLTLDLLSGAPVGSVYQEEVPHDIPAGHRGACGDDLFYVTTDVSTLWLGRRDPLTSILSTWSSPNLGRHVAKVTALDPSRVAVLLAGQGTFVGGDKVLALQWNAASQSWQEDPTFTQQPENRVEGSCFLGDRSQDSPFVLFGCLSDETVVISTFTVASGAVESFRFPLGSSSVRPNFQAWAFPTGSSNAPSRFLVALEDGRTLFFSRKSELLWSSEQGMAYPLQAVISPSGKEIGGGSESIFQTLTRVISSFLWSFTHITSLDEDSAIRFGFHKNVIVATSPGRVLALDSWHGGRVVWASTLAPELRPLRLFLTSSESDNPVVAVVLGTRQPTETEPTAGSPPSIEAASHVAWLCAATGKILHEESLSADGLVRVSSVFLLPKDCGCREFASLGDSLALVAPEGESVQLRVLPAACNQAVASRREPLYFQHVTHDSVLQGFMVYKGSVHPTWSMQLPKDKSQIFLASRDSSEMVPFLDRLVQSRAVDRKYLNPHLLAVATVHSETNGISTVKFSLVDGVSGALIHSFKQPHASGPVRLLLTENALVYHLWATKAKRFEVGVVELYERQGVSAAPEPFNSLHSREVYSRSQSYVYPSPALSIGLSKTLHGLTPKRVLMTQPTGRVHSVDRRLLDPHREPWTQETPPTGPLPALPYEVMILADPQAMVTQDRLVPNVHSVISAPAELESTSHVVCLGTGVFYSRVFPAKTFDVVTSRFQYSYVLLAVAALFAAVLFMRYLSRRRALANAWK